MIPALLALSCRACWINTAWKSIPPIPPKPPSRSVESSSSHTSAGGAGGVVSRRPAPVPVAGIVNSIAFSADGRLLAAAVGHEHRLGAWHKSRAARDGVLFIRLPKAVAR